MRVVACSTTTADMTFMTAGGVATLYPEFTLRQKRMQRGHAAVPREGESNWNIRE
jgi:hypothetical protein